MSMTAIESALTQFRSDRIYKTIPVPERLQMEELISHLFSRATVDMSIHIFRRPARMDGERDFTVISFTEYPIAIRKVAAATKYWLIKNTDTERALQYEMSTKTIVVNWTEPLRARVISVDYGKQRADLTDFFWEEEATEASVQSETAVTLDSTHYCLPHDMTWDKIVEELERAGLVELRMRDSEINCYPVDIGKIAELEGEFNITVRHLDASRQNQFIKQHLLYLYNKHLR